MPERIPRSGVVPPIRVAQPAPDFPVEIASVVAAFALLPHSHKHDLAGVMLQEVLHDSHHLVPVRLLVNRPMVYGKIVAIMLDADVHGPDAGTQLLIQSPILALGQLASVQRHRLVRAREVQLSHEGFVGDVFHPIWVGLLGVAVEEWQLHIPQPRHPGLRILRSIAHVLELVVFDPAQTVNLSKRRDVCSGDRRTSCSMPRRLQGWCHSAADKTHGI
mmetsp:Transcript_107519/g.302631  ORF Transcript_107519/g.302631 Transcript_107519/m.302631 type:complete len:218 (-) Transcript_107519:108-761(-)